MTTQVSPLAGGPLSRRAAPGSLQYAVPNFNLVKFGFPGIRARYRGMPGRQLRLIDPYSCELKTFPSPLQYENWLLRRFNPEIWSIDSSGRRFEALNRGARLVAKPHLHWASTTCSGALDLVIAPGRNLHEEKWEDFKRVALCHGLVPCLRTPEDIRSQPALLDLLDRIRQLLVLNLREMRNEVAGTRIVNAIKSAGGMSRSQVHIACATPDASNANIDALLFWLRQQGRIQFDLLGGGYGDNTAIFTA